MTGERTHGGRAGRRPDTWISARAVVLLILSKGKQTRRCVERNAALHPVNILHTSRMISHALSELLRAGVIEYDNPRPDYVAAGKGKEPVWVPVYQLADKGNEEATAIRATLMWLCAHFPPTA